MGRTNERGGRRAGATGAEEVPVRSTRPVRAPDALVEASETEPLERSHRRRERTRPAEGRERREHRVRDPTRLRREDERSASRRSRSTYVDAPREPLPAQRADDVVGVPHRASTRRVKKESSSTRQRHDDRVRRSRPDTFYDVPQEPVRASDEGHTKRSSGGRGSREGRRERERTRERERDHTRAYERLERRQSGQGVERPTSRPALNAPDRLERRDSRAMRPEPRMALPTAAPLPEAPPLPSAGAAPAPEGRKRFSLGSLPFLGRDLGAQGSRARTEKGGAMGTVPTAAYAPAAPAAAPPAPMPNPTSRAENKSTRRATTPSRVKRILTPVQRHGLLKALVQMQMAQEFLDLGRADMLALYGYPFGNESSDGRRAPSRSLFAKKKASAVAQPNEVASGEEPLILRHMFQVHLRHLPGLNRAPLSFWRKRIQRLNDTYANAAMSSSLERSEYVLTHTLSLVGTQYLGQYFARGFGVRGPGEERGPGLGDPGTHEWGVGKAWGAGTVKRGLDKPYELTEHDSHLINNLFQGAERDAWMAAGSESDRIQDDWAAFKEQIIEQETGLEEVVSHLSISQTKNLPEAYQNAEEWVRIHVADAMRWLFVESPAADGLFNFVRVSHTLFPYWAARQALKVANAQTMIQIMLSLLLSQPVGTKSLFQRLVGYVVSREISAIQREYVDPLRKEISDAALVSKIEAYVRQKTPQESERIEKETRASGNDILTTILLSRSDGGVDEPTRARVLDLQRAFAASPYRSSPDLAYPTTTPRGKNTPPILGWGATIADSSKARLFALLKLHLRESLNKRDREQFAALLNTGLVPEILKEGAQIIFYDAIRSVASVADLSARLGDVQQLISDMIEVRKSNDNSSERWVDLATKHHEFIYFFAHECAPVAQPLWEWCQAGCDFMSLSTTDPLNPADRNAKDLEVNLDELLQDPSLRADDVQGVLSEMDAWEEWSRWSKIRRELAFRSSFLLRLRPSKTGVWQETIPTSAMRKAVRDIDGMMYDLLRTDRTPLDDGTCDEVRGSERAALPWAYFDAEDPLGQALLAEPVSGEHRVRRPPVNVRAPELHYTRKLLPLFRAVLVDELPDWLDPERNGDPRLRPSGA